MSSSANHLRYVIAFAPGVPEGYATKWNEAIRLRFGIATQRLE